MAKKDTPRGSIVRTTLAVAVAALAAFVAAGFSGPAAASAGPSAEQLAEAGWACFVPPPLPNTVVCYPPGLGRPFLGDTTPSYHGLGFDRMTGEWVFKVHLIHSDLYRGQPCAPGNDPYRPIPLGYHECVRMVDA